jgi:hypothetical protein
MIFSRSKEPERVEQRRPCEVDGSKAWYHGLIHCDQALLKAGAYEGQPDAYAACHREFRVTGKVPMYCDVVIVRRTYAMVEYLDGSVSKVDPEKVHFIDV